MEALKRLAGFKLPINQVPIEPNDRTADNLDLGALIGGESESSLSPRGVDVPKRVLEANPVVILGDNFFLRGA